MQQWKYISVDYCLELSMRIIIISMLIGLFIATHSSQFNNWLSKDTTITLIQIGCALNILKALHNVCLVVSHQDLSIEKNKLYWLHKYDSSFIYQKHSQGSLALQWARHYNTNTYNDSLSNHQEICHTILLNKHVQSIAHNDLTLSQGVLHMLFGISIIGILHYINSFCL